MLLWERADITKAFKPKVSIVLKKIGVEWSKGILNPSQRMEGRSAAEEKPLSVTLKRVAETCLYTIFFMQIAELIMHFQKCL